ncbi:glucosidase [Aureibacter tunicatorum]|uniref:Glucosidase n=1 Tax=Aureibacter tunicatorum TaxID=866807 RepID=A0AAE3XNZ6_9BACT|nr:glucosidase [Aureibacter tunicatorum]MDR6239385.1 hypothetical protein [Aureibacter tunicatorum]BDD04692.1 glucosidase [Aureibacter tunicatorum]
MNSQTIEGQRLEISRSNDNNEDWLYWGPYLSERQWGTVREDYSEDGNAWNYFSHDQSRSRAYRWGEDGLAGISDPEQKLCFSISLWNNNDPIIKERLFGLTNSEGNHGEDVKEYYFYLDSSPTHSYMKWLYKYPHNAFPYENLVQENERRKSIPGSLEYELIDTGIFNNDEYFDVEVEYAKASPSDLCVKVNIRNHADHSAKIKVMPTLWFRNTWSWFENVEKPMLKGDFRSDIGTAEIYASASSDKSTSEMKLYCQTPNDILFVENESNKKKLWQTENNTKYPKDGINDYLIHQSDSINPDKEGTKSSALYDLELQAGEIKTIKVRLSNNTNLENPFSEEFDQTFENRINECNEFYNQVTPQQLSDEQKMIQRQAYAGMLWSKQYYHYVVADWLKGDPTQPTPPLGRSRNSQWQHMYASNVISMPDAWEYPWFAAWDLCFHTVIFSRIDIEFAKKQLRLLTNEWYMSPNGAKPAYEWAFSDLNPPLHAWAALKIFENEEEITGNKDYGFLSDIFNHCLMNFTWWVNRVDEENNNLFEGGFLGLDNISVINRSKLSDFENAIGKKVTMNQSDGTSWMGMFSLKMMEIALKLGEQNPSEYSHLASKFFQHFVFIADAMNNVEHKSNGKVKLWDDSDGFYYDFLTIYDNPTQYVSIKLKSIIGIIALFPIAKLNHGVLDDSCSRKLKEKMDWFIQQHPELIDQVKTTKEDNEDEMLLSFVNPERLKIILQKVFNESEFLSPHGIRGISQIYRDQPFSLSIDGVTLTEKYTPAESEDQTFGGNSNWRGPVWFPINFLFIETLEKYHEFLGDDFKIEYPTNSGKQLSLKEIANDLTNRLIGIFEKNTHGKRPFHGENSTFQENSTWQDLILYYEYFHGDNGAGIGASHQTGWTGLVAELLHRNQKN